MATASRPPVVATLPRSLYLETTNRCDSKCQTCIRTFQSLEPPADLTLAQVKAIAEQFPVLERVVLHGIGEPLLNAEIFEIVAYLKSRAPIVLFNSDAISLTATRARRLIETGLDEYRVSLDAASTSSIAWWPTCGGSSSSSANGADRCRASRSGSRPRGRTSTSSRRSCNWPPTSVSTKSTCNGSSSTASDSPQPRMRCTAGCTGRSRNYSMRPRGSRSRS